MTELTAQLSTMRGVEGEPPSFFLLYLRRELRGRLRQLLLVAAGLAVGIGLVLTVTAATDGVKDAQTSVLHSLYGRGTDVTVTAAPQNHASGKQGLFSVGKSSQHYNLLRVSFGLGVIDMRSVKTVSRLPHVAAVAGGLMLTATDLHIPAASHIKGGGHLGNATMTTVDGLDVRELGLGPYSSARLVAGSKFTVGDTDADMAIVDAGYAAKSGLKVGSVVKVAGERFKVIGIVRQSHQPGAVDVYLPLARAQTLATTGDGTKVGDAVSTIYVKATSPSEIAVAHAEIAKRLPHATVTNSTSLASAASGSLASVTSLTSDLGRWLTIAALIAAFATAGLLNATSFSKRVHELGTLKALGWKSTRIVSQMLVEATIAGVIGAAIGIGLGFAGAAVINAVGPRLSATVAANPGSSPAMGVVINGGTLHQRPLPNAVHTVAVHMHAPLHSDAVALAIVLALAGALIAAGLTARQAIRLSPAEALARLA